MVRVFVVHQSEMVGSMIVATLTKSRDIRVIDQATTASEALSRLGNNNCDVVLVSASLADNGAQKLIKTLKREQSSTKTIATGLDDQKSVILDYICAGASGYILKDVDIEKWDDIVRAVSEGRVYVSPQIAAALMIRVSQLSKMTAHTRFNPTAFANLTRRESEVLDLIAQDLSNKEIAERLIIGVGTVKNHVHNILKKLELNSRRDAKSYVSLVRREKGQPNVRMAQRMSAS